MHRLLHRVGRRLAMLLVAVMLFVPVADAFACAAEPVAAHATVDEDATMDAAQHASDDGHAHGVCAHNHCHHNATGVACDLRIRASALDTRTLWAWHDDHPPSGDTDSLLRPPRT